MQAKSGTTQDTNKSALGHLINVVSFNQPLISDEPAATRLNNIVFGSIHAFYDLFTLLE